MKSLPLLWTTILKGDEMKVALPTVGYRGLEEELSPHFGRTPTFTIVDTEKEEWEVISNKSEHSGGIGSPPEHLLGEGVEVVLCTGLGIRAIEAFKQYDMEVYVGAMGKVKDALEQWKRGKLAKASDDNACREHRR